MGDTVKALKLVLFSSAFALIAATAASAADIYNGRGNPKDEGVYSPPFTWTGMYVGLQAGYAWDRNSDVPWGGLGGPLTENDGPLVYKSFVGGAHAGYNFQSGRFVYGIEGDVDIAPGKGDDEQRGGDVNGLDTNFMASIRARAGLAFDRSLIYVTGGYAYLDADGVVRNVPQQSNISTSFNGLTVGGGWEHAWTNALTFRLEYRYTNFDLKAEDYDTAGYRLGFEPDLHAVRAGISYKFGGHSDSESLK